MNQDNAKIFLFDIDYTLLYSGGAGSKAMTLAFAELYGIADAFQGMPFAGWTDRAILKAGLDRHSLLQPGQGSDDGDFEAHLRRFHDAYHRILPQMLRQLQGKVLAGVADLLAALRDRPGILMGVATGNFRVGADLKLRYYGLSDYFLGGAYGDDYEERPHLVAAAARHVAQAGSLAAAPSAVYVLGDTPYDIRAAKASGLTAVGVATGPYSLDDLKAAGADFVFPDLGDWRSVLALLLGGPTHQEPVTR